MYSDMSLNDCIAVFILSDISALTVILGGLNVSCSNAAVANGMVQIPIYMSCSNCSILHCSGGWVLMLGLEP